MRGGGGGGGGREAGAGAASTAYVHRLFSWSTSREPLIGFNGGNGGSGGGGGGETGAGAASTAYVLQTFLSVFIVFHQENVFPQIGIVHGPWPSGYGSFRKLTAMCGVSTRESSHFRTPAAGRCIETFI